VYTYVCSRPLCKQARQAGMLDAQVFSLQARRALLHSLDLIPAQYTYTAASAAVQAVGKGSGAEREATPPPSHPSGRKLPSHSSVIPPAGGRSHKVRSTRDPGMQPAIVTDLFAAHVRDYLAGTRFFKFSSLQAAPTAAATSTTGFLHPSAEHPLKVFKQHMPAGIASHGSWR
jgi:hypothetical protein